MTLRLLTTGLAALLLLSGGIHAQETEKAPRRGAQQGQGGPQHQLPQVTLPSGVDVVLGRPTAHSVTLSLLRADRDGGVVLAWGREDFSAQTRVLALKKDQPQEFVLGELQADTGYRYQLREAESGKALLAGRFHTQRPAGSSFTFTVTADSHLDKNTSPALYQQTLANALADAPDFHIDLGDTFMTEKHPDRDSAAAQYLAQRFYFGQVASAMPLFLVMGNHDGESAKQHRGTDSLAVWANQMRKRYFPNPLPDAFYSGNTLADSEAGFLQNYYAWTWGDALFVALDPYWNASNQKSDDSWGLTLGDAQYQWLKRTLENSRARYKFVLIHQLVGGQGKQGRGGVEMAHFAEWGGKNADGSDGFAAKRPGWAMPIHELLVRNQVSMVLHGHDHLFATQELDGIVYQEVPQPAHAGGNLPREASEYGYQTGTILGGSGHMRFKVTPAKVSVDFMRTDRQIAHSYSVLPK